jgi:hypothetical protein
MSRSFALPLARRRGGPEHFDDAAEHLPYFIEDVYNKRRHNPRTKPSLPH